MKRTPPRRPVPVEWDTAARTWERAMTCAGTAAATVSVRLTHVRQLARAVPAGPWDTTADHLAQYVDARPWKPATRRNYIKTFRAFYRWAHTAGLADHDPAVSLPLTLTATETARVEALADPHAVRAATGPERLPVPAPWQAWLTDFRRHSLASGSPLTTINTRATHLARIARALDPITPADVTTDDLLDYLAVQDWKAETRRGVRQTLRTFYRWAGETGRIDNDPAAPLPRVKSSPPLPRPVTEDAYRFALALADDREQLALRLAAEMGLRRAEVAGIHSRDIVDTETGRALVVHGKGDKRRILPLPDGIGRDLATRPPGYVFTNGNGGHLSPRWVGTLVRRLLPQGTTMHQLRHRFATLAYQTTRDLITVQQVLGHASPATTQRYVAVSDDQARDLMNRVSHATT